jgi:hypothetical protein
MIYQKKKGDNVFYITAIVATPHQSSYQSKQVPDWLSKDFYPEDGYHKEDTG